MAIFKTEVTSETLLSDNPIHQRLLKPYLYVEDKVGGVVAEIGCGDGRGIELLAPKCQRFVALDKSTKIARKRAREYANEGIEFVETLIPPIPLPDNTFDVVISFQVIEHITEDTTFLEELHRILKPGGKLYLTTPNVALTLTRNPWHVREYRAEELKALAGAIFSHAQMLGISGNDKVMSYYEENKESVARITRWDILKLQQRLPSSLLRVPYEIMNRVNRNLLKNRNQGLVQEVSHEDYLISQQPDRSLDLFLIATK